MKTYNRNAAILLFEKVKLLDSQPHDSWRCIYLRLSDMKQRYNPGLRTYFIINAITDLLAGTEGSVYACEDGDVFILFQGPLKPVVSKLASHFHDLKPEQAGQPNDTIFTIFDLSKYWQLFFNLCKVKSRQAILAAEAGTHFPYQRRTDKTHAQVTQD